MMRIVRSYFPFTKEPVINSWLNALTDARDRTGMVLQGINPWDAIVDLLRQKYNLLISSPTALHLQRESGSSTPEQPKTMAVKGRNLITGLPDSLEINLTEIQKADNSQKTRPYLSWSPQGSNQTLGKLLYSIAAQEANWLFISVRQQPFPDDVQRLFPGDEAEIAVFIQDEMVAQHYHRLQVVRNYLIQTYSEMSFEDFQQSHHTPSSYHSAEWVLHELCQFEAERRSEMAALFTAAKKALNPEKPL
ncbi:MAG TPA: rod shape-determining protein [Phototrophicaceae bacterium]|nr:rod shape-determining protein [Phototrophicaceae bacterium]